MPSMQDYQISKSISKIDGKCLWTCSLRKLCRSPVLKRYVFCANVIEYPEITYFFIFFIGSGSCPDCKIPLRRNNFRVQLFEDPAVEKEVDIRKRVLKDFNKKEEDFSTLAEYNDYLEEVETIIYNLANNIDVINTNKRIEQYKKENKDYITKNKGKLGREEYELEEILEMEKQLEEQRKAEIKMEEVEAKRKKIQQKEALIDELMFSNANAQNIIATFEKTAKEAKLEEEQEVKPPPAKVSKFSSGIQFGKQATTGFLPIPTDEGPLFVYKPPVFVTDGPRPPTLEEILNDGYTNHVRAETEQERAGGFHSYVACMRALQDALAGLYHVKRTAVK